MNTSPHVTEKQKPDPQSRISKHGCSKREAQQGCEQDNHRRSCRFPHPKILPATWSVPDDGGMSQLHERREHRRRLMQGLGKPIISFENRGHRVVCIGKEVRWSKSSRTFPDFLFDYIKVKLTPEWGNAELAKPEAERHPLLLWYHKVCMLQQALPKGPNGVYSAEMTGAVRAYLGLAYDLYLCAHNAELPELLLKHLAILGHSKARFMKRASSAIWRARVFISNWKTRQTPTDRIAH